VARGRRVSLVACELRLASLGTDLGPGNSLFTLHALTEFNQAVRFVCSTFALMAT